MAVTLEQVRLMTREYEVPGEKFYRVVDIMRSEGLQREKCVKYSLTPHQIHHLPPQYRPPLGSFGSCHS